MLNASWSFLRCGTENFTLELAEEEAHQSIWLPQGTLNDVSIFYYSTYGSGTNRAVFSDPLSSSEYQLGMWVPFIDNKTNTNNNN